MVDLCLSSFGHLIVQKWIFGTSVIVVLYFSFLVICISVEFCLVLPQSLKNNSVWST